MADKLRIAVAAEADRGLDAPVSAHFGRCPWYVVCEVEDGRAVAVENLANPHFQAHHPGEVPRFIKEREVDVMLSGGMGRRALELFASFGIAVATGAAGTVGRTLEAYLAGRLDGDDPCAGHGHGDCDH